MGIPHLYKWLKNRNYKGVLRRNVPQYVSSFSLDFNSIIHEVAQMVYAYGKGENPIRKKILERNDPNMLEAELYQSLSVKLLQIIAQVQPRETLVIAVDGVAPQAKIAQQRQRRFRAAMESTSSSIFNSSAITPGTEFMKRLDNFIQRWLVSSSHLLPPKVIYSSHMVPGEGEHKVLSLMRSGEISGNGAHVVYGMDADLIMLNLLAPVKPIFLMREDINDVIDIENFKTAIEEELGGNTAITDFVVMMFLIGNDFLPHIVSLTDLDESIETLMRIYKINGTKLTNDKEINWEGFSSYLKALSLEENRLLELESIREVKYPSRMMEMATTRSSLLRTGKITEVTTAKVENISRFDPETFRSAWYKNAFDLKTENKVFEKLMPGYKFETTNNKIVELVKSYLTGISWVYRYYSSGMEHINTDFVYRSHYAPLITDISGIASLVGDKVVIEKELYEFNENALEINPVHQLLSVIPLKSKELLPIEVMHLTKENSIIADYFPESQIIERDGVNNDWQGIVLINFINMGRIIEAVELTSIFSPQRIEEFSPVNNIILKKDPEVIALEMKNLKFKQYLQKESGGYQKPQGRGYQKPYEQKGRGYQKPYEQKGRGYQKPYEQKGRGYQKSYNKDYQKRNEFGVKTYSGKSSAGRGENVKSSQLETPVSFIAPSSSIIKPKTLQIQKFEL